MSQLGVGKCNRRLQWARTRADNRLRMRALQLDVLGKELMASLWKRRDRDTGVTVRHVAAPVTDAAALDRLLAPLPEASELRPRLMRAFFARAWDVKLQCDYWVRSDGAHVVCFTIRGLTLQQAAAVRVRWDAKRRRKLSQEALADVIAAHIGCSVTLES